MEIYMRKYLKFAAGIALLVGVLFNARFAQAQVYSEYIDGGYIVRNMPYEELHPFLKTVIPANQFGLPPSYAPNHDDGYKQVPLPFPFEYNDQVYNYIWVSINGFAQFAQTPLALPADNPRGLFLDESSSYPTNVLAPFWGDHYLRTQDDVIDGYMPSEISYMTLDNDSVFVIQWKNLNINDESIRSSVANFQLRLYRSENPTTYHGDIGFCYGTVGGNPNTQDTRVITRNASVGIKGTSSGFFTSSADFLNGLFTNDLVEARTDTTLTNVWPPSGATDRCVYYESNIPVSLASSWGDGDTDLSHGANQRHYLMPQNRFVTYEDVRLIMRSQATDVPLDSVRKREAFHADVNHNGRFYYKTTGERVDIPWKSMNYADDLPSEINSIQRIFYQATEYDAAIILSYLAAKVPELPWLLDTIIDYGKIDVTLSDAGVKFGSPVNISGNTYQVPVYLTSDYAGPVSLNMNFDQTITDVAVFSDDMEKEYTDSKVVLAGYGKFKVENPLCIVTFTSDVPVLNVTDIRYNDASEDDIAFNVTSVEENTYNGITVTAQPNPFTVSTNITVANLGSGDYELAIYDLLGNKVKSISSSVSSGNILNAIWDGTDMTGNMVESGMYIYRLTGNGVSVSNRIFFSK